MQMIPDSDDSLQQSSSLLECQTATDLIIADELIDDETAHLAYNNNDNHTAVPPISSATSPPSLLATISCLLLLLLASVPPVVLLLSRLDVCQTNAGQPNASAAADITNEWTRSFCHRSGGTLHENATMIQSVLHDVLDEEPETFVPVQVHNNNINNESCSCFRRARQCCHRKVLRSHKFGYMVTQELYKPFSPQISRGAMDNAFSKNNDGDYRHVVILRDIFEAIVSGYLYHQTGHECWLSFNGYKVSHPKNFNWERYMSLDDVPFPPRNGRSICQYLVDEAPQDAMRVYIDVALSKWYGGIEPYFQEVEQRRSIDPIERTWVVCFEDYTNASKKEQLFQESMDFLYPGGQHFVIPVLEPAEPYTGPHATIHDSETHDRLLKLIHELDESMFGNALQRLNQFHNCARHRYR